jgi:hypothetical protein
MTIRIPSVTVFPDKAPPKVWETTYVKVKEEPEVEVEELVPLSAAISVRPFCSGKNSKKSYKKETTKMDLFSLKTEQSKRM